MGKIYLIRHGQTLWNAAMRFQGSSDVELSEEGVEQAKLLAQRFNAVQLAAVYASDLKRAGYTAEILASAHGLPVTVYHELREINCGQWEGLTGVEIEERFPGQLELFFSQPGRFAPPGGESFYDIGCRSVPVFEEIAVKHREENVAIVAHGGVIRAIIGHILMMEQDALWRVRQDNTAVNIIGVYERKRIIELINDTSHLF